MGASEIRVRFFMAAFAGYPASGTLQWRTYTENNIPKTYRGCLAGFMNSAYGIQAENMNKGTFSKYNDFIMRRIILQF